MKNILFNTNRKNLWGSLEENSITLIFAGEAPYKSADEKYAFTPNRNFYYLTGVDKDKMILMIVKIKGKAEEILFVEKSDPVLARWVGEKMSKVEAKEISGIQNIEFLENFKNLFNSILEKTKIENLYLDLERQEFDISMSTSQRFAKVVTQRYPYLKVQNIYHEIASLRLIKSEEEINLIRKAIDITDRGIKQLMKNAKVGIKEYQLEAYFDFSLKSDGVMDYAFHTIAACGRNATILHYVKNDSELQDGKLVLFDLGAQYKYYNADISRTFPINGKYTERQKQVYNVVLRAQEAVTAIAKPGILFSVLNETAKEVLAAGCIELGLIKEPSELPKYYFHGVSHYLGLDTHDVGNRDIELKPGMVCTNEPGLYIEEENIGIRIEDDILITKDGCENLSKQIIKTVDEIEAFMAK
ncbi:aminopeptidase P family protein [Clostridium estertheticum]|uniref:Xaa-Pro aminopeptidase n=1 Tax=Clostridium estertheticum TaxID=238834 RepID=A0A7Y3WRK2_9CLOT|nr:aminopeptidase P family protein [Clostridium estertheticum]MBW9169976.1 aminopeptidase P family protein [Clostridium estertheticum]NNU75058.1 aminopeptidase P family protein [Clostridium estertheticum]WBL47510.1 aminopeptidase P family protein [Clostridium estertheticum]WLC75668.1 aminopeptidase P family protein [Clostridium estertheticum]